MERKKNEHARISEIVTTTIGHLEDWKKKDGYFGMYEELSKLKDYLDFHTIKEQYKGALNEADLEFQERREAHVHEQLELYNDAHFIKEEDTTWGWSSLYQTFFRDFSKT